MGQTSEQEENAPRGKRKPSLYAGFLLLLLVVAALAARPLWHQSREWLQHRNLLRAAEFMERGDVRSAYLLVQQILQRTPNNREAIVLMIRLQERANSPEVLFWKRRLSQLFPNDTGLLIDLALSAIKLDNPALAQHVLGEIPKSEQQSPAYLQAAASLAITTKNYDTAANYFAQILEKNPSDAQQRYNLANMRIKSARKESVDAARADLNQLLTQPAWRTAALRSLLVDSRMRQDDGQSMRLASELNHQPDATHIDHLLYLEELQHAKSPDFDHQLQAFAATCKDSAESAYALLTWMNAHGLPGRSLEWSQTLPAKVSTQNPVPMAIAEACVLTGSWSKLNQLFENAYWGTMDFMRMAFLARATEQVNGNRDGAAFQSYWNRAKVLSNSEPNALGLLVRMAEGWGWKSQAMEIWWQLALQPYGQQTALKHLQDYYESTHNTAQLLRVSERVLALDPGNPGASNNVAYYALLLNRDLEKASALAKRNYQQHPDLPPIVATYALATLLQKNPTQARDLMATLPDSFLQEPSVAACYGTILAACGDFAKARPYLIIASDHRATLLPEETALSEQAIRALP